MQYREVGDTGITVSTLGFGTMRFKSKENAAEIIHHGLPLGLTYFDIGSAYSYKAFDDNAETWTGEAIRGVPREKMVLSAKAQPRAGEARVEVGLGINTRDQMWQCVENSLKRVGVEWFDFYQLWDMSAEDHFEAGCQGPDSPLQALREARDQGLVKHLGFTSHGSPEHVIRCLEAVPDFRFVTVYYNFNDRGPERAIDFAADRGVGVCIMGPLRGGLLVGESEAFARALPELQGLEIQEVALRFLLGTRGVTTVISGMNEPAHLEQNARVAALPEPMTAAQREQFLRAFGEFSKGEGLCTGCNYCADACPQGLPVMGLMGNYQLHEIFGVVSVAPQIAGLHGQEKGPAACTGCEECVEKCPQKLPIPARMERLTALAAELAGTAKG